MKMLKTVFFLCLTMACIVVNDAYSQLIPASGPTSSGCYRLGVSKIQSVPPLHTDMPLKTLLGYIYLDSLCKSITNRNQIDSFAQLLVSVDTLKHFMSFLCAMNSYNAQLFSQYTILGYDVSGGQYKVTPAALLDVIYEKQQELLGDTSQLKYITSAPIIVHGRVTSIVNDSDSYASIPKNPLPLKCVTIQLLDVIKGNHLLSNCGQYLAASENEPVCMNFSFSPFHKKEGGTDTYTSSYTSGPIMGKNIYGDSAVSVNSEYIFFLGDSFQDHSGSIVYFDVSPHGGPYRNGGIYKIESNGTVLDSSNFWKLGAAPTVATLKQRINSILQYILSY